MCSTSFKNLNFFISTVHLTLLSFVQLGTVRNFKIELTEMLLIRIFYMVRRIETLPASFIFWARPWSLLQVDHVSSICGWPIYPIFMKQMLASAQTSTLSSNRYWVNLNPWQFVFLNDGDRICVLSKRWRNYQVAFKWWFVKWGWCAISVKTVTDISQIRMWCESSK